ncbi:hypothetical protein, partial [Sulfuricurvum sp.]|uniref:hypothetical protein n=1 Tax=Sulfuricurvum sp. TaxID=2025608 RepID=UPI003BB4A4C1
VIVFVIFMIPDVAWKISMYYLSEKNKYEKIITNEIKDYEKKYNSQFYLIDVKKENLTTEEKERRKITIDVNNRDFCATVYKYSKLMSYFKQNENTMKTLATILPLLFASIMVGGLLSYRFLIQKAHELNIKKYDFILEIEKLKYSKNSIPVTIDPS